MIKEGRPMIVPALVPLSSDPSLERGGPIETERSLLLGVTGVAVYNSTGTTRGDGIKPATTGYGTHAEGHSGSNGGDGGDDAASKPRIIISRTRLLAILCALWVASFLHFSFPPSEPYFNMIPTYNIWFYSHYYVLPHKTSV